MVERPIKKADRQPQPEARESSPREKVADDSDKKRSSRGGDKDKRDKRDKRSSRDEESKQPVNLALVRGPKPTKPQPVVEVVTPEVSELIEENTPE